MSFKNIKELEAEIMKLNEEIIALKEKPSEEHTIFMMTHSSLCGEARGKEDVLKLIDEIQIKYVYDWKEELKKRILG